MRDLLEELLTQNEELPEDGQVLELPDRQPFRPGEEPATEKSETAGISRGATRYADLREEEDGQSASPEKSRGSEGRQAHPDEISAPGRGENASEGWSGRGAALLDTMGPKDTGKTSDAVEGNFSETGISTEEMESAGGRARLDFGRTEGIPLPREGEGWYGEESRGRQKGSPTQKKSRTGEDASGAEHGFAGGSVWHRRENVSPAEGAEELYRRMVRAGWEREGSRPAADTVVVERRTEVTTGLTAEKLDRTVRRDSRRYDGGMELY